MKRIFISGANRGIGLELVRQYLAQADTQVIATCRQPEQADALQALAHSNPAKLHIVALDVADAASIAMAAKTVSGLVDGVDVLMNNAGTNPPDNRAKSLGQLEMDMLMSIFQTNAAGSLLLTQAFLPLLQNGNLPRVVMVSSQMGSLGRDNSGRGYGYRMSKAAMNMAARTLAADLQPQGIIVITLHPGWVQTDMGGSDADITPEDSAAGILRLIDGLTMQDNGKFYKWNGDEHSW